MAEGGHTVTRAQFERNLHEKARSRGFRRDIQPLLRPDFNRDFDIDKALDIVRERLIKMLPGEPWQGSEAAEADCRLIDTRPAVQRTLQRDNQDKSILRGARDRDSEA